MIVKMIQILEINQRQRLINYKKHWAKDIEDLSIKQAEMQNTITELKNSLEATTSRIQKAEEWISEEEQRLVQITDVEGNEKKDWVSSHCYTVETVESV